MTRITSGHRRHGVVHTSMSGRDGTRATANSRVATDSIPRGPVAGLLIAALLATLLISVRADAGWVRPLEGSGNFHSMVDMINRWRPDGGLDVVLMISVANREITFKAREGKIMGELLVHARMQTDDGRTIERERTVYVRTGDAVEAGSATLYQVFPMVLPGVDAAGGEVVCIIEDRNRPKVGLLSAMKDEFATSESAGMWDAPPQRAEETGLALDNPVFLAGAPIETWGYGTALSQEIERSQVFEFMHPNRRYGLENDHMQVYFEAVPPLDGDLTNVTDGVFVQVLAKDLAFALRDTVTFEDRALQTLHSGVPAGIYYDLDVNLLPPGPYQLSCAPLSGTGRSFVAEFDVIWSLSVLSRHRDELEGEAKTVLLKGPLKEFMAAGQAEREVMLEKFWSELDPDPETPVNEAYIEFRSRVAYVRQHLGGFGSSGAREDRGRLFLLLGPPDEIQAEVMPLNSRDQEDAVAKVFDKYAPDRPGTQAKGSHPEGTQGKNPWDRSGGVPMSYNYQSRRELEAKQRSIGRDMSFELWRYNNNGHQLFPNIYSGQTLGLNFLFVDRNGTGKYYLETTNVRRISN